MTRRTRDWGTRFDHAYSQIIDWLWTIWDQRRTRAFHDLFGGGDDVRFSAMFVIGREAFLQEQDRTRLHWRQEKVRIDSQHVSVVTFDSLCADLRQRATLYSAAWAARWCGSRLSDPQRGSPERSRVDSSAGGTRELPD